MAGEIGEWAQSHATVEFFRPLLRGLDRGKGGEKKTADTDRPAA